MRTKPGSSQIATILTLVMAVIFLFIVITINIGNIAQEKTMVSNVSDNAALLLASMLGSLSNGLRMKLGLWGTKEEDCDLDFLLVQIIGAAIALIVSIVLVIIAPPVGLGGVLLAIATIAGFSAGFVGGVLTAVQEPGSFKQAQLQFMNMTFEERLKEMGIQASLYSLVGDPNKNCVDKPCLTTGGGDPALYGGCSDPQDLDMDGDKTDCVSCFPYWYTERLKSLPRKGDVVQAIFNALFSGGLKKDGQDLKSPRIYLLPDEKNWKAIDGSYGFWIDINNDKKADADESADPGSKGKLSMGYTDDPHNIAGVVYEHDIYFVHWLEYRFTPLVKRLSEYGYGLSPDLEKTLKDIDFLTNETLEFEGGAAGLFGTDFDSRLQSFEEWMPVFYNGTEEQDWCDRMQEWIDKIQPWIDTLQLRVNDITQCASSCEADGPYQCGSAAGDQVCGQTLIPKTCTRTVEQTCTDGITGETYDCSYEEEYDCSYCEDARWCNCGPGVMDGGRLCPSGHCKPTQTCDTPPDGGKGGSSVPCCTIADNGLYYQLCEVSTNPSGGGSDGKCSAEPCKDTYYNCPFDPGNNVITREHAVEYLTQFRDDVRAIIEAFKNGYNEAKLKESDPRLYEALYEWEDYAGRRGEVTSQRVKHAVYVRLSDDLKPNDKDPEKGFQLPSPHQYREWGWPSFGNRKCTRVEKEKGEFGIVVARYDQDVGTAPTAPLKNLWVFKTRAKTSGTEPAFLLSYIDSSQPVTKEASKFVLENGIVSATKAHYGPGYTYTKEELKTRDPNILKAREFNKDIKIERANWKDFIKD